MADVSSLNPLANLQIGSLSFIASALLVLFICVIIIGLIGVLVYIMSVKKQYWIKIPVFKMVGNTPTRVNNFVAKDVVLSGAGDKLWRVAPKGFFAPFKVIKWLPVGKFQSSHNEYWYWIRKDGEWINFSLKDIDTVSDEMEVKFVQEDMRLQRLATEKILEQRLLTKSFWDKYGNMIATLGFFLVITICMVIIFYQWAGIIDKMGSLTSQIDLALKTANNINQGLIPT